MALHSWARFSTVLLLCLLLAFPSFPQAFSGHIGPSTGEVVGVVVGVVAAAVVVVVVLVVHDSHKHTIDGCVASGPDGLTLLNKKDNKVYALSGDYASLKAGERVALKGQKNKDSSGKSIFQVNKVNKNYGACTP